MSTMDINLRIDLKAQDFSFGHELKFTSINFLSTRINIVLQAVNDC